MLAAMLTSCRSQPPQHKVVSHTFLLLPFWCEKSRQVLTRLSREDSQLL